MTSLPASLDQRFADSMGDLLGPNFPTDIGLAVSGGGDSMAMLALAHNWTHRFGVRLWVLTVDHGLRPEAAQEAAMVARECRALGHGHAIARWSWDGQGNLQDAARMARLALIDHWRGLLTHVLVAHTKDDVAETFLLRLKRGSGVDGLAAMTARRRVALTDTQRIKPAGLTGDLPPQDRPFKGTRGRPGFFHLLRPCLDMQREELRHYARVLQIPWAEDPSNNDSRFDRVKMRQLLPVLAAAGLDVDTLSDTAKRMARARDALSRRAVDIAGKIEIKSGMIDSGELLWDRDGFEATDRDTQLRLLAAGLQYVANAEYRPRAAPLEALLDRLLGGGGGTLHGGDARAERSHIRIFREFQAVRDLRATVGDRNLWDGRWRLWGKEFEGLTIRALGEDGWRQIATKPAWAPPFHSAKSLPSIWDGGSLVACDALGVGPGRTTRLCPLGQEMYGFKGFLLSH